jgi:hypothetical protein
MKLLLQQRFFGNVHYVWCSEACDSGGASPYEFASLVPPSSNPKDIYQALRQAVEKGDKHDPKIVSARAFYVQHATELHLKGALSEGDRDEVIHMVNNAELKLWRPLLYIIQRDPVAGRLKVVPPAKRAGHGPEFIIEDLVRAEFEIVEL